MELIHYWRVVRRWAGLIILCPLLGALAAGLISLQLAKVYEAQVSLLVRPAQPLSIDPGVQALTADRSEIVHLRTRPPSAAEPPRRADRRTRLGRWLGERHEREC